MSEASDYEVEHLVSIRRNAPSNGHCGIRVLIKWKGFSEKSNTWEPLENLTPASAPALLEELESAVRNNSVKRQMVKEALGIIYSQHPELNPLEKKKKKSKSPIKFTDSESQKIRRKNNKLKDVLSVTNQSINSGIHSNFSDPFNAALTSQHIQVKPQHTHSPSIQKKAPKNLEALQDIEQSGRHSKGPTLLQPVTCDSVIVTHSNSQTPKGSTLKRNFEEYYTGIQRESTTSDVYLVSKVWVDTRDKEVINSELIELMHEFKLTSEKEALMKLCLQRLTRIENSFQRVSDWTIRTLNKRIDDQ
jgi:hypothetical protein